MDKSSGSLISVVIPCYNCEDTLSRTLKSFENQNDEDFELVLVDDGSNDSTGTKCENYRTTFPNRKIKVIHKNNGGLVSAWKTGVHEASGDYILFCDADDYVDNNLIECMLGAINEEHYDLVMFGVVNEYGNNKSIKHNNQLSPGVYDKKAIEEHVLPFWFFTGDMESGVCLHSRWSKLFKRNFLLSFMDRVPNDISWGEDDLTAFCAILRANKIKIMADYFPYHYDRSGMTMTTVYDNTWLEKWLYLLECLKTEAKITCYQYSGQISNEFFSLVMLYLKKEIELSKTSKSEQIKKIINIRNVLEQKEILSEVDISRYSIKEFVFSYLFLKEKYGLLYYSTKIVARLI